MFDDKAGLRPPDFRTMSSALDVCPDAIARAVALVPFRRLTLRNPRRSESTIGRNTQWVQWSADYRLWGMRLKWTAVLRLNLRPKTGFGRALRS
jgi:hypothetical protein